MHPIGTKTIRFPAKVDNHPKRGEKNWWEFENEFLENKAYAKELLKKEMEQELYDTKD